MGRDIGFRYILGELIGYTLIYSGVARLFLNRRLARGEVTAFFLHNPEKDVFAKVMLQARRWGFEFINDQQLLDHLNGKQVSSKPLLHISIDDGWKNNLVNVAEFAEKNHIPVTYFISTEAMESGNFWWTRLTDATAFHLWTVSNENRRSYLDQLAKGERTQLEREAMTPDQVLALSKMSHATIGNHTHTHPILANCTDSEIEYELSEAHQRLTKLTSKNLQAFAYPSGAVNGYERVWLARMDYIMAYSVEPRGIRSNENIYNIPRFADNRHAGFAENFCRLIGLWQSIYNFFGKKPFTTKRADAMDSTPSQPIRLIQLVPEPYTTFRADIVSLFGKYLPRNDVQCHLVGTIGQHDAMVQGVKLNKIQRVKNRLKKEIIYWRSCMSTLLKANKTNCDVIQVRDVVFVGFVALCIARLKGIPFCYWMSFIMSEARIEIARSKLKEKFSIKQTFVLCKGLLGSFLLYRIMLPNAQHVFVQSDAMASYVQSRGINAEKITAVPMGVDTEQFAGQDLEGERPVAWGNRPVIAYLGTLTKSRNIETLIDAFGLVRDQIPQARLALIGASDVKNGNEEILAYAHQKGLSDSVEITGWLPTHDAWKLLVKADVAISYIPRNEMYDLSSPTKLMEYLAVGIPCVANDSPDQAHVMNQSQAGWLVTSDIHAMANALIEILSDPNAARARSAAGPGYIEAKRSYRVLAEMVARQYRRLVQIEVRS